MSLTHLDFVQGLVSTLNIDPNSDVYFNSYFQIKFLTERAMC